MISLRFFHGEQWLAADLAAAHDLSISLDFHGPQPNHFGADQARAEPMRAGDFVGDTRAGGSCNAEVLSLNPHCNGTHTECLGHVTRERIAVSKVLRDSLMPAALVSVEPVAGSDCRDSCVPEIQTNDRVISAHALGEAWARLPGGEYPALVVRTLPNPASKQQRRYLPESAHPWFTLDAIDLLVECGVRHLLVDTPSLDRYDDGGRLAAHRRFWGLDGRDGEPDELRYHCTITEMIYVADAIADGVYLLNLQIAPFVSDAAPSRPLLYPVETL